MAMMPMPKLLVLSRTTTVTVPDDDGACAVGLVM